MHHMSGSCPRLLLAVALLALGGSSTLADDFIPYTPTETNPVLEPWRWTSYPELAGTGVQRMAQTPDGAMWFGVDDGVRRYDGLEWTSFTADDGILGRKVQALHVDPSGVLYIGTETGISRFDDGRFQPVFPLPATCTGPYTICNRCMANCGPAQTSAC